MELELLAPAGNLEKLKAAFHFGADACYFAGKRYGLRAFAGNFEEDELLESIAYAHSLGKKAYITVNIIAHNNDFNQLADYIRFLESAGADAVICADVGIIQLVRQVAPNLPVHVSTQANVTNKYAAQFFANMGVTRIVLARELSLEEVKEIRSFLPKEVELEAFIHGAMCISYSGRCLLSNYFTGRDGNRGACAQPCRWNYSLVEKNRPDEQYDIEEDERGTYILNSKDLNMLEHLNKLVEAGITSFKIEGRMKSPYYVASVVNAYRRALNSIANLSNINDYKPNPALVAELEKTSHRKFTTGFYLNEKVKENTLTSTPTQNSIVIAVVKQVLGNDRYLLEQRNKFSIGDQLEILSPSEHFNKEITITSLQNTNGEPVTVANLVQQELIIASPLPLLEGDMLRKSTVEQTIEV